MLSEFVQQFTDTAKDVVNSIHTAIPAKIVAVDKNTCTVSVQPAMKLKTPSGEKIDYPVISGVPIVYPQTYDQAITIAYPVKEGDSCLLIVSEQSLDYWMYEQETPTELHFDLTDSICIPGLFNRPSPAMLKALETNSLVIKAPSLVIDGNVTINGNLTTYGGVVNLN